MACQPLYLEQCQTQLSLPPSINNDDELLVLSELFSELMMKEKISVPNNYLLFSAKAMVQLAHHNHSNVLYNLAKGIGTYRQDGSDLCFPCERMPMGLLEYMADFFSYKNIQLVCV